MKKTRKGFTLVELLIVISILGALSASMAGSMGNSTAAAKASVIAGNIDTCLMATKLYYAEHFNDPDIKTQKATRILSDDYSEYVPNWKKFKSGGNITYSAYGEAGPDSWAVQVSFDAAPDAAAIATALGKIKGYEDVPELTTTNKRFKVTLMSGDVREYSDS